MGVSSITVTKTNFQLLPGATETFEAKVNYDDGSADYNYRVVAAPSGLLQVRHAGGQVVVWDGKAAGQTSLKIISNRDPAVAAEVKIAVAGPAAKPVPSAAPVVPPVAPRTSPEARPATAMPFTLTNAQYIDRLYQEILRRPADPAGRNYWSRMLARNLCTRDEARAAFLQSPEAKTGAA